MIKEALVIVWRALLNCYWNFAKRQTSKPESVIRLLRANKPAFSHLFRRFSVTMEPHCALKAAKHLFKNIGYYHHNANDRFGLNNEHESHE